MAERVRVAGASPAKLVGYLKGLGLLRVVGRQADPAARACWRDGALELHSDMDQAGLEAFLIDRWVPAPVVSPWNGGSGFFPNDNTAAFEAIEADHSERLGPFRVAIAAGRKALQDTGLAEKPGSKEAKASLLRELRANLPDDALEWLDAAIVLVGEGTAFPPVLGSGGNDGRYDIANNYAQAVVAALAIGGDERDRDEEVEGLATALWGGPGSLRKMSLAHFLRDASPVNSPSGESDALGNPWDLALGVEGALLLTAGAGRRLADGAPAALVAPFTLQSTGAGYGSAAAGEKGRAEMWLPLWSRPASLAEIEALFREARAQVGRRNVHTGLDAARATSEMGVARGIDVFQRFSILERAGQSNLAVPAGRIEVRPRPGALALRTLDPWLGRLLSYGRGDVPQAQREALARLERAAFDAAEKGTPASLESLIVAMGELEGRLALADERHRPLGLRPISPAARPWVEALDRASLEVRLALGFSSVADRAGGGEMHRLPALRDYLHGTGYDDRGRRQYGITTLGRVPALETAVNRLAAAHERRHLDAARADGEELGFPYGLPVAFDDLAGFVAGQADDAVIGKLVDGLVLLDYRGVRLPRRPTAVPMPDPLLGVLELAFHDRDQPAPSREGREPCRPRPGWAAALRRAQVRSVTAEALLRLQLAGLSPIPAIDDLQTARADGARLAAALLARPHSRDLRSLTASLTFGSTTLQPQESTA